MDRKQFLELIGKQARGKTSLQEDRLIVRTYDLMQEKGRGPEWTVHEEPFIKDRIKRKIDRDISLHSRKKTITPLIFKVAASLAFLVFFSLMFMDEFNTATVQKNLEIVTGPSQKATVNLADGTLVHLNINSKISFPEHFEGSFRTVELEGEAFFDVVKDAGRPFTVKSNGVHTRVLGTSFNVNAFEGKPVEVAVRTGSVEVSKANDKHVKALLNPRQKGLLNQEDSGFLVEEVDMDEYFAWRESTVGFNLAPFDEVIRTLARMYNLNMTIKGNEGRDCLIKAEYSNKNISSVLYGLKNLVDFEFEVVDDKKIVIDYRSCK